MKEAKISGFKNDIDGFMQFCPLSVNNNTKELVGSLRSKEILEWFEQNPDLAKKIPPDLRCFENISYADNPIVVIAKSR